MSQDIKVERARLLQIVPLPAGWYSPSNEQRVVALAVVELTLSSTDFPNWTGRDVFPLLDDMYISGLPDGARLELSALGDHSIGNEGQEIVFDPGWQT